MQVLVIGAAQFLGRYLAKELLSYGHSVTLFHHKAPSSSLFSEVETIVGERQKGLDAISGRIWDAVIDISGNYPSVVAQNVDVLEHIAETYVFLSSISVYADFSLSNLDELADTTELSRRANPNEDEPATYGARKALCELAVEVGFPEKHILIRPGVLAGPYDVLGRLCYWLRRAGAGGEILAPDHADRPLQFIDARDLAQWIVQLLGKERYGIFNAVGPEKRLAFGQFLDDCCAIIGRDCSFTFVDESFLLEQNVQPWVQLPLWIPESIGGLMEIDASKAQENGLNLRAVTSTIRDTWEWMKQQKGLVFREEPSWISKEREESLLQAWRNLHSNIQ